MNFTKQDFVKPDWSQAAFINLDRIKGEHTMDKMKEEEFQDEVYVMSYSANIYVGLKDTATGYTSSLIVA